MTNDLEARCQAVYESTSPYRLSVLIESKLPSINERLSAGLPYDIAFEGKTYRITKSEQPWKNSARMTIRQGITSGLTCLVRALGWCIHGIAVRIGNWGIRMAFYRR